MDKYDQKAARRRNTIEFLKMDMAAAVYEYRKTSAINNVPITAPRVIVKRRKTIGVWKGGV